VGSERSEDNLLAGEIDPVDVNGTIELIYESPRRGGAASCRAGSYCHIRLDHRDTEYESKYSAGAYCQSPSNLYARVGDNYI
jgi:hypothetical protein